MFDFLLNSPNSSSIDLAQDFDNSRNIFDVEQDYNIQLDSDSKSNAYIVEDQLNNFF